MLATVLKMMAGARTCVAHYEDLVDPRATISERHSILKCLGFPYYDMTDYEIPIQETFPILETIANAEEVEKKLRGTKYEYMLEDAALDPRPTIHDAKNIEYGFLDS